MHKPLIIIGSVLMAVASCFFASAKATIRNVPSVFPTVAEALQAAAVGDTVLLARGLYVNSVTVPVDVTIASQWMFTSDSTDIAETIWQPDTGSILRADNRTLSIIGIHFVSTIPRPRRNVINSSNVHATIDHCIIEGSFDTTRYANNAIIKVRLLSSLQVSNSRFFGDNFGASPTIHSLFGPLTIDHCIFQNRELSHDIFTVKGYHDTLVLRNTVFDVRGDVVSFDGEAHIVNCAFLGTGSMTLELSNYQYGDIVIDSCLFDSNVLDAPFPYMFPVLYLDEVVSPIRFRDCRFVNADGNQRNMQFARVMGRAVFTKCEFTGFHDFNPAFRGEYIQFDSCTFSQHPDPLFGQTEAGQQLWINNCDFSQSNFAQQSMPYPSVTALNNWWGHETGPFCTTNQTGQGIQIPDYVQYIPFRTTPVFPENEIGEPGKVTYSLPNSIELLPAYPNPFNSSVTIRFRLPQPGDATISIYDLTGREVATLHRGYLPATSPQTIHWQPQQLASGSYFIQVQSGSGHAIENIRYIK